MIENSKMKKEQFRALERKTLYDIIDNFMTINQTADVVKVLNSKKNSTKAKLRSLALRKKEYIKIDCDNVSESIVKLLEFHFLIFKPIICLDRLGHRRWVSFIEDHPEFGEASAKSAITTLDELRINIKKKAEEKKEKEKHG